MSIRLYAPSISVPKARRYKTCTPGRCLRYVATWLGGPWGIGLPNANSALKATQKLHTGDYCPPAGVPVYFTGSEDGHVALSVGRGVVRSTDYPRKGVVSEVKIDVLAAKWGRKYAGWGEDIKGQLIPGVWKGHKYPGKTLGITAKGPNVRLIQARLKALGYAIAVDGSFGPKTKKVLQTFQHEFHLTADGLAGPKTWRVLKP